MDSRMSDCGTFVPPKKKPELETAKREAANVNSEWYLRFSRFTFHVIELLEQGVLFLPGLLYN